MTKLNPCPDCGREPDFEEGAKVFRVACWDCSPIEFVTARTASGAINAWNAATSDGTTNQSGKTLRDEFAMAALAGLQQVYWETIEGYESGKHLVKCMAESAYEIADTMLKERSK